MAADLLPVAFGTVRVLSDKVVDLGDLIGPNQIENISYSDIRNKPDSCKISITNLTMEQVENEVLQEEKALLVSWGIYGKWQIDKTVIIKELEWTYGSTIKVTVTCRDRKVKLLDRKAGRVWTKLTSSQIVEDIARRMGMGFIGVPTPDIIRVVQGGQSYGKILSDLAWLEGYYWTVNADNEIEFKPDWVFRSQKPSFTWYIGRDPNIIDCKVKTTSRRIAPKTAGSKEGEGTTATSTNTDTGVPVVETQNAAETPASGDGLDLSFITFFEDGGFTEKEVKGEVDVHPANEDAPVAKKRAKAKVLPAKWKTGEVSITAENKPVEAGDVIKLLGVANIHTGLYKVQGVDSRYDGAKIRLQLKLKKDTGKRKGKKPENPSPAEGAEDTTKKNEEVAERSTVRFNKDGSYTEVIK